MMAREEAAVGALPEAERALLGAYEGLRGYHMLPEGGAGLPQVDRQLPETVGLTHAAALSQVRLLPEELAAQQALFPDGCLDQDLQQIDLGQTATKGDVQELRAALRETELRMTVKLGGVLIAGVGVLAAMNYFP